MRLLHKTAGFLLILSFLGVMTLLSSSAAVRNLQHVQLYSVQSTGGRGSELLPNDKSSCPAECTEYTISLAPLNDLVHPFFSSNPLHSSSGTYLRLQQTFLPAPLLAGVHIKTVVLRL